MSLLSTPISGAPATSETTSQPAEQAKETQPLTLADVERIAEEKATRIAQSMVDKAEHRISKKAQEQIKALESTKDVLGLSDEQVRQAKQTIVYSDLTSTPEQASPAPTTQTSAPDNVHPVIAETLEIFKQEGITIETTDPEYQTLEKILNDPNGNIHQYRKALYKQIEVKRARVETNAAAAPARVVSGGGTQSGEPTNLSAHDAWENAYKI